MGTNIERLAEIERQFYRKAETSHFLPSKNSYSSGVGEELPIYVQTHMLKDTKILNTSGDGRD